MAEFWGSQISNRNFLSPVGFKFSITRIPKADFFANQANIPGIDLGFTLQPSYLKDIPIPGDKMTYSDFNLRFIIDENMENYLEVHKWLRGLGYPENMDEFRKLEGEAILPGNFGNAGDDIYSDGTLQILSSNLVPSFQVVFSDLFPYTLSTVTFDATDTDIEYFTADVTFKYTIYKITDIDDNDL